MDSINGVLGILISTVKRGFIIFFFTQIQSRLKANVHFNRGAYHQVCFSANSRQLRAVFRSFS